LIEKMAQQCAALALQPDAGIWEYRGRARIHTHSAAMCWAGLSRAGAIANRLGLAERAAHWNGLAGKVGNAILERCWNEKRQAFTQYYGSEDLDASVLIMPLVFFMAPTDPRMISTLKAILENPRTGGLVNDGLNDSNPTACKNNNGIVVSLIFIHRSEQSTCCQVAARTSAVESALESAFHSAQ